MLQPGRRLLFRLALRLGRTIAELEETLTSDEYHEWVAFDLIDPIGDIRNDVNAAHGVATLRNVNKRPNSSPDSIADCMIEWGKEAIEKMETDPEFVAAQVKASMMALMEKHNKQFASSSSG